MIISQLIPYLKYFCVILSILGISFATVNIYLKVKVVFIFFKIIIEKNSTYI